VQAGERRRRRRRTGGVLLLGRDQDRVLMISCRNGKAMDAPEGVPCVGLWEIRLFGDFAPRTRNGGIFSATVIGASVYINVYVFLVLYRGCLRLL
jgi:hypothetical protein